MDNVLDEWDESGPEPTAEADLAALLEPNTDAQAVAEVIRISISSETEVTVAGIEGMRTDQVLRQLKVVADSTNTLGRAAVKLYKVLGDLLVYIEKNKEVYEAAGFDSFTAFCDEHLTQQLGVSKGTRYRALELARNFGSLSGEQIAQVGVINLMDLKKTFGGEKEPAAREQLDKLLANPTPEGKREFRELLKKVGVDEGRTLIQIWATPAVAELWREFCETAEVQAYVANEGQAKVLESMIEECKIEWIQRGRQMMEAIRIEAEDPYAE